MSYKKYDHLHEEIIELYEEYGRWVQVVNEIRSRHPKVFKGLTDKGLAITFKRMCDRLGHKSLREEILDPHKVPIGQVRHYWDKTNGVSAFVKIEPEDIIKLEERIENVVNRFVKDSKPFKIFKNKDSKALIGTVTDEHIGMNPNPNNKGLFTYEYNAEIYAQKLELYFNSLVGQRDIFGTFEVLYLDNLGDKQDGYNGFTTRGGHSLEQNMTNEEVFELCVESKLRLIENCINEGIAKKYILVDVSNDNHCYTEDTEVLTTNGWKFYHQLKNDDLVASLDLCSDEIVFDKPLAYIVNDFDGEIHCYENKNVKLKVTDEHRMLLKRARYKKQNRIYDYEKSKDILNTSQINFRVSGQQNIKDYPISDELIRFTAWILTDGSIIKYKNTNTGFAIYQSKEKTKKIIIDLLDKIGCGYRQSVIKRRYKEVCGKKLVVPHKDCTEFVLNKVNTDIKTLNYLLDLIPSKNVLPSWLYKMSKRQFDIFLNEFILGDGSIKPGVDTSASIYGLKSILDQLQALCVINNTKANLLENNRGDYILSVVYNRNECSFNHRKQFKKEKYRGKTWCLTMPCSNMVVRREGRVSIQGNSGNFGLMINLTVAKIINRVYSDEIITSKILRNFMEVVKYGNHTFIKTHGKDEQYMRSGLPFDLTDKAIRFINEYINHYNLSGFIHLDKGDLHRLGYTKYKLFDYNNFMSFAPGSNWIGHNFGDSYSGYSLRVVDKEKEEIIKTDYFLNYSKRV